MTRPLLRAIRAKVLYSSSLGLAAGEATWLATGWSAKIVPELWRRVHVAAYWRSPRTYACRPGSLSRYTAKIISAMMKIV